MPMERRDWETCSQDDCIGVRLPTTVFCLAHAVEHAPGSFDAELKRIGAEGTIDARGVVISAKLLGQVLLATPHKDNRLTFTAARFDRATFQSSVGFEAATFKGTAGFTGATFQGDAWFAGATFHGRSGFDRASFRGDAMFTAATFHGLSGFEEATFQNMAGFTNATFQYMAVFAGATFHGRSGFAGASFQEMPVFTGATFKDMAGFARATFHDMAGFARVTFQGDAVFDQVSFQGDASFGGASFQQEATFDRASFERAEQLGPLLAYRGLVLDRVQFTRPVQIEAAALGLCCRGASFPGGVQFRLRWARVALDDTDLAAPCILASIPALADDHLAEQEQRIARAWRRLLGDAISPEPRLLSLRRANVAGLSLAGVDLTDCRFGGTHHLDKLRFDAEVSFGMDPTRLAWDTRQVIADERAWRAQHARRWTAPTYPAWVDAWLGQRRPSVIEPVPIAGRYRMLRKGREDNKDEPGAADFYYGEMEMRRHAHRGRTSGASRGRVERGILTAYWLVSGYGLRAWRALAWLLVVLLTATAALRAVGFTDHRQSWSSALLYTAGAVTRLVNPPDGLLTEPGQAIRLVVGLLGPILLALALLALRGRVKR